MVIIDAKEVVKYYNNGNVANKVLKNISLTITKGEFVSIIGPSGSGKTTLLYVLSGLEPYNGGSTKIFNKELNTYKDKEISTLRSSKMGFVFQFYNLIPNLTVYENVMLAKVLSTNQENITIEQVLKDVDIYDYKNYYPSQISGGTQQRVAIARCLINNPDLIFADEPIGNLDYCNGISIMELFKKLNIKYHKTILLVTHNEEMIKYGTRFVKLIDGEIILDEKVD